MASFPQVSPPTPCAPTLLPHTRHMPCPSHSSRFNHPENIMGKEYRSFSSSLCDFLHSPVTSSLLCPNTLLNTLFSNTLSLCSSFMSPTRFHTHTKLRAKL